MEDERRRDETRQDTGCEVQGARARKECKPVIPLTMSPTSSSDVQPTTPTVFLAYTSQIDLMASSYPLCEISATSVLLFFLPCTWWLHSSCDVNKGAP